MRIAQVAPLWERVPPQAYGGTERIVSYIMEELVRLGHQVTLFASADSLTTARLEAMYPCALRSAGLKNPGAVELLMLERVFQQASRFDVIHSHLDILAFPLTRRSRTPVVTTVHGRLDLPELGPVFREFAELPVVAISNAQRKLLPWANWRGTVHHGLPEDLYELRPGPGRFLAFLGRFSPEKRPDHAIEVAKRVGMPLRIAAKIDLADRHYFREVIEPLLDHPLIEYVGEISDREKQDFLGDAYAMVAPYDWPEPFGLVFIEALACGTPIVAYHRGSVPEIVEEGVNGFVCRDLDEMVTAIGRVGRLDRRQCRSTFERRFTRQRMVQEYLKIYESVVQESGETAARSRRWMNRRQNQRAIVQRRAPSLAHPSAV